MFLTAAIAFAVTAAIVMFVYSMAEKGEGGLPWLLSYILALFVAGAALLVMRYLIGLRLTARTAALTVVACLLLIGAAMFAANEFGERTPLSLTQPAAVDSASLVHV